MTFKFSPPSLRRGLAVALALAILLLIVFWRARADPMRALPAQTALALEMRRWGELREIQDSVADPAWQQVWKTGPLRILQEDMDLAERLFQSEWNVISKRPLTRCRLVAGLTLQPADSLHGLLAVDLGSDLGGLRAALDRSELPARVLPTTFRGHTLYTVYVSRQEKLVIVQWKSLLVFSRFSYLVEDALLELEESWLRWNRRPWQSPVWAEAPLQAWVRPAALSGWLAGLPSERWLPWQKTLDDNIPWIGLGWDGRDMRLWARAGGFWAALQGWAGRPEAELLAIVPENTAFMGYATLDNRRSFFRSLKGSGEADFEKYIQPWVGREVGYVVTEPFSPGLCDDRFVVLGVRDSAEALRSLRAYGRERGSLQAPDEYQTFELFEFLSPSVLEPFAGPGCSFQHPVCAMIGGYVVFADSRPGLELWIDKYIVNQTLTNRTDVLQLLGQHGGSGLGWLYLNTAYLPALFRHLVPESAQSRPSADLPALARLGLWAFDLQDGPGRQLRARPAVQPTAEAAGAQTSILWKTPLAAGAIGAPYVVGPPGENARVSVLIQDEKFQLYCLDAEGEVRWRRQLPSRLLSAVHGIDYLGNQSVGYLFNTAESIWLLDEGGNDLEGFPLQLQSEATNGVTVVDFDGNAQFSFFIACANGNVYGYDQFGRPLPGWNPQPGQGRVDHPLLHFQRGGKDYLVALNRAGRLAAFGRTGERRFPAVAWGGKFPGPPQVDTGRLAPRIVAFDAGGVAHICNLSGQTFAVKVGAGRDGPALGVFGPLSGDARYEFAVLEKDRIKALGYSGEGLKPVFNRTLPAPQDTVFAASGQRLGTLSRAKRQVLLLDGRGQTVAGFPLAGSTPFALSDRLRKNREEVLLVGYGANLYAYVVR